MATFRRTCPAFVGRPRFLGGSYLDYGSGAAAAFLAGHLSMSKPLPQGVTYLGTMRCRTRKLVDGKRLDKTFPTARLAREWLESASVAVRAGKFVDSRPLDRMTVGPMVDRFAEETMQEGGPRRGYKQDMGHVLALKTDEISLLPRSKLTPFAVRNFRVSQLEAGFTKATVVKRMDLLA